MSLCKTVVLSLALLMATLGTAVAGEFDPGVKVDCHIQGAIGSTSVDLGKGIDRLGCGGVVTGRCVQLSNGSGYRIVNRLICSMESADADGIDLRLRAGMDIFGTRALLVSEGEFTDWSDPAAGRPLDSLTGVTLCSGVKNCSVQIDVALDMDPHAPGGKLAANLRIDTIQTAPGPAKPTISPTRSAFVDNKTPTSKSSGHFGPAAKAAPRSAPSKLKRKP